MCDHLTSRSGEADVDWFGDPGLEHSAMSPPAFSTKTKITWFISSVQRKSWLIIRVTIEDILTIAIGHMDIAIVLPYM